jgi:hypothetical protein
MFGLKRKKNCWKSSLTIKDTLMARVFDKNGKLKEQRKLGHNLVVDDGMEYIVDAWQNSVELETMKYHDTGIGTTAASASDSGMETATGFTRGTGTLTEGDNAKEFKSVATVSCTATKAVTEWGIFSASSGGVLGARNTFSAINVVNGDSIEFTWECQLSSS